MTGYQFVILNFLQKKDSADDRLPYIFSVEAYPVVGFSNICLLSLSTEG